jgi:HSF-type DNA-binding
MWSKEQSTFCGTDDIARAWFLEMVGRGMLRRNIRARRHEPSEACCTHSLTGQTTDTMSYLHECQESANDSIELEACVCRNRRHVHPSSLFPAKLHVALQEIERAHLDHIISWAAHGRCFMIHKRIEFVQQVLPR